MAIKLKIVTDASCRRRGFYKGPSVGVAKFYDENGELLETRDFPLGELTPYAAECETILCALNYAIGKFTREQAEVWCDNQILVRHMNFDYLLTKESSRDYFDKLTLASSRFRKGVRYIHQVRKTPLAKGLHDAALRAHDKYYGQFKTSLE